MPEITVALLGFGNVARSFARRVAAEGAPVRIRAAADRSGGLVFTDSGELERALALKEAGGTLRQLAPERIQSDVRVFLAALPQAGVSILVESLPSNLADGQPALSLIGSALILGIDVVTVDKGPLVHAHEVLRVAARSRGAVLKTSGATGVAPPSAEIGDAIVIEIRGILNGTTNYILTAMQEEGLGFHEALRRAQSAGIAEPDPRLDIEGWDAAAKILILSNLLMSAAAALDDVARVAIGPETEALIDAARAAGRRVRPLARARIWQGRVRLSVAPKIVRPDSPFYSVTGTSKAALFRTEEREIVASASSGREEIARIVLEDVLEAAALR